MGSKRARGLRLLRHHTAHGEPVVTIVVIGRIHVAGIEVQVTRVGGITVRRSRPVVPVRATVVELAAVVVAGEQEANNSP